MAVQSCAFFHNLFVGHVNFTYRKCLNYYVVDYLCVFLLLIYVCADHTPLLLQIAKQHAEELAAQTKSLKKKMRDEVGEYANVKLLFS